MIEAKSLENNYQFNYQPLAPTYALCVGGSPPPDPISKRLAEDKAIKALMQEVNRIQFELPRELQRPETFELQRPQMFDLFEIQRPQTFNFLFEIERQQGSNLVELLRQPELFQNEQALFVIPSKSIISTVISAITGFFARFLPERQR